MTTEHSMVLVKPREMEMREFAVPDIDDESFLLKVDLVSICGGDPIEYEGRNIKARYPMILGHEMTGTIERIGDGAAKQYGVDVGDRVNVEPYILCGKCEYCLNGHYQFCVNSRIYGVNMSCETPPHIWGAYGQYLYGAPGSKVHKIAPGVPDEAIQPVGIRITDDRKWAFVALGPANRVAVIDAQTFEVEDYLLTGQRVWQLAFSPDEKFLYTTNGVSNDVSVIDVENLEVVKSITVGQLPWGVAVKG